MSEPQFPNYSKQVQMPTQPNPQQPPQGIPFVDPKYHKPLYKMMKQMLKPKKAPLKIKRGHKGKKRVAFH